MLVVEIHKHMLIFYYVKNKNKENFVIYSMAKYNRYLLLEILQNDFPGQSSIYTKKNL